MTPELITLPQHLVAQCTVFGWVVTGAMYYIGQQAPTEMSHQLFCLSDFSDKAVRSLGDLESVGISSGEMSTVDPVFRAF